MKSNFGVSNNSKNNDNESTTNDSEQKNLTKEEFEDFIIKAGASGSFMVFRSKKKDDELGIDEL